MKTNNSNNRYIAKTFQGLEDVLEKELIALGAENVEQLRRAVQFTGSTELLYKANLHLRTALSILVPLKEFDVFNADSLYKGVKEIEWENLMNLNDSFAVNANITTRIFNHSGFVALKTKDAIVDRFRENMGKRPSVDSDKPDIEINVHISNQKCTVSLNSSGDQLFKRGYRTESEAAPLNEVLAAGMIQISGWDKQALLIDPMCGSGTIPIEAALYALNIPSNILRTQYGFMNFKDFDESLWNTIYNEAFNHYQSNLESVCPIMASDISERAYFSTRRNIKNLKLEKAIQLQVKPFEKLDVPEGKKMILTNPPYGERLNTANVLDLYSAIGSRLKHYYVDNEAWILSNNIDAINAIGLKATKKLVLFNGALECRFLNYHMYASSKKIFAPENNI